MTVKGPSIGAPSLVTSFADFQRQFGGYLSEYTHGEYRYLPYAVDQFFLNGGTRCYVTRSSPRMPSGHRQGRGFCPCGLPMRQVGNRILVSFTTVNRRKMQLIDKEGDMVYRAKSTAGFNVIDLLG